MYLNEGQGNFAGKLWNYLQRVDYRVASSQSERSDIYTLRYNAYLRDEAILPHSSKKLSDEYDEMDNCWNFAVYIDDEMAGAIRIHLITPDSPRGPAVDFFPDIVKPMLDEGKVLIDPTRFVVDRELAPIYPEMPYLTMRAAFMAYEAFEADFGLASVRKEHRAFYRRAFKAEEICEPRPYPPLTVQLGLMRSNVSEFRDQLLARYPIFQSSLTERRLLFGQSAKVGASHTGEKVIKLAS